MAWAQRLIRSHEIRSSIYLSHGSRWGRFFNLHSAMLFPYNVHVLQYVLNANWYVNIWYNNYACPASSGRKPETKQHPDPGYPDAILSGPVTILFIRLNRITVVYVVNKLCYDYNYRLWVSLICACAQIVILVIQTISTSGHVSRHPWPKGSE